MPSLCSVSGLAQFRSSDWNWSTRWKRKSVQFKRLAYKVSCKHLALSLPVTWTDLQPTQLTTNRTWDSEHEHASLILISYYSFFCTHIWRYLQVSPTGFRLWQQKYVRMIIFDSLLILRGTYWAELCSAVTCYAMVTLKIHSLQCIQYSFFI